MAAKKNVLPFDKKRKRLIKIQSKTNPNYGKKPDEKSVEELLKNSLILVDKPKGPTSHQIDAWVKKIIDVEKIGHSGTLDPNATGLLPIGVGDATKILPVLLIPGKEYIGIMKLHKDVSKKKITEASKSFIGEISQLPPVRSAVKRVKRKKKIYYFDILEKKDREVLFKVGCESGTYVRTLCVDLGKKLKIKAHLSDLRRTKIGHLHEKNSVFLQDVKDAMVFYKEDNDKKTIKKILKPVEEMISFLPKIVIRDSAVDALCHGADLAVPGVVEIDSEIKKDDTAAVMTLKGEAVAIVKTLMSTEDIIRKDTGICADLKRVLMKKGTYPPIWKKS